MPWDERSRMDLRKEMVALAEQGDVSVTELSQRYKVSRKTAHKWLARYRQTGEAGLADRSRRPKTSPGRTEAASEQLVLDLREKHPRWGGRKLRAWLLAKGHQEVPSASTITEILRRHGLLSPEESLKHTPCQTFEHPEANAMWQVDFKGHFALVRGRCHPLTVLDDHSRFSICLQACGDETGQTVKQRLTEAFRRYGLPVRMTMDNGAPWGSEGSERQEGRSFTALTVWLMRLGIRVGHSRPYHPQTQGKDERFHRTLNVEVLQGRLFSDLERCQQAFDTWRQVYNHERPHEALGLAVPVSRYRPSPRPFPETLPEIVYDHGDLVRKVGRDGYVRVLGRTIKLSQAFRGLPVAFRPASQEDGLWKVYFQTHRIAQLDLRHRPPEA